MKPKIWSYKRRTNEPNSYDNTIVEIKKENVIVRLMGDDLKKLFEILDKINNEN